MLQPLPGICDVYKHVFHEIGDTNIHKVVVGNDNNLGPCLQFDNDPPIQIPEPAMFVKGFSRWGLEKALFLGHDTDDVYLIYSNGGALNLGKKGKGKNPFAFDLDGIEIIQSDESFPGYASEGIHHIEPDGRIVMNNDPSLFGEMHGMKLHHIDRDGEFIVAVTDKFINAGVCLITPTHIYYYNQSTSNPPYIVHSGGVIWVAVQGSQWRNTFDPEFPQWDHVEEINGGTPPVDPPVGNEIVFNIPGPIKAGQVIRLMVT
jgi:hypothetical protein